MISNMIPVKKIVADKIQTAIQMVNLNLAVMYWIILTILTYAT